MMTDPSQEPPNIGEMVLHHTADAWTIPIDFPFYHARSTCRAGPTCTSGR